MGYYADDVELVVDPGAFLEGGTFTGKRAVGEWFAGWFATFEPGYRFEIEEAREQGEVVYLVAAHHGRGRTSGAEVRGRTGYLYTVREGRIARVELFRSPEDALEELGRRATPG
jgi:ketosteroid isomerase-like protein